MPRVRWCGPLPVLCLLGVLCRIAPADADCWYSDDMHEEGAEVPTAEPCLNCTCNRGTLLCYLRICTRLPNPPPPGCILLHRYRTCCPELICNDVYGGGNSLEARSEPEGLDLPQDTRILQNACLANGSIYGPGSAMDSSSLCEYCYCLAGRQTCVKPKCLLPIEGCVPMYEPTNCCPVHYNCSYGTTTTTTRTTSTTTLKPTPTGGCWVDRVYYKEGGKVLGVGHSACDNCYCLRGILRCEPLSCAPPLLGCTPVVRPGECCAASYNCSGTIEIQPKPNYGQYPTVSKEYAKLRKEVQHQNKKNAVTENSNIPFYVIAESSKMTTKEQNHRIFGTTRHISPSTVNPKLSGVYYATTIDDFEDSNSRVNPTTDGFDNIEDNLRSSDYLDGLTDDTLLSIVDSLLDNRLNRGVDSTTESPQTTTSLEYTTSTTEEFTTETTTTIDSTTTSNGTLQEREDFLEVTTILPVDASEINKLEFSTTSDYYSTETTTNEDSTEVDLESRVSSATLRNIPQAALEIETILNSTSKDKSQDYEYDYNEPSLPPSLPNLRIIPFVAADALDLKKDKDSAVYTPQDKVSPDSAFGYSNLFSPPVETEGGFLPKEPPILDNFYENAVTLASVTNNITPKPSEENCVSDGREIAHGESVASESPCVTCTCFYRNIVCQKTPCPVPDKGCKKYSVSDGNLCCPHYVCDDKEAPTVVLDRLPNNSSPPASPVTVAEGVNTPDPFRDVIRTEPAPNLQSLIVDMIPLLARKTTPIPTTTTEKNATETDFSFDKVFQLLFSSQNEEPPVPESENATEQADAVTTNMGITTAPSVTETAKTTSSGTAAELEMENRDSSNHPNSVDSTSSGMALLKLAGCNIYGRMYRVGRIISELSNPCLECKCTEIGVQCRALQC